MVGHLQVFVLADWLPVNQPIEYLETTKGLRWLIPRQELPWKNDNSSDWPHQEKLETMTSTEIDICFTNSSYMWYDIPVPIEVYPKSGWLHGQHSMRMPPYGQPLDSNEYFTYFLVSICFSIQRLCSSLMKTTRLLIIYVTERRAVVC